MPPTSSSAIDTLITGIACGVRPRFPSRSGSGSPGARFVTRFAHTAATEPVILRSSGLMLNEPAICFQCMVTNSGGDGLAGIPRYRIKAPQRSDIKGFTRPASVATLALDQEPDPAWVKEPVSQFT